jgi:hypothetical protein
VLPVRSLDWYEDPAFGVGDVRGLGHPRGVCVPPEIRKPDVGKNAGSEDGELDEFGSAYEGESGGGEGGGELPHNACVVAPDEDNYGYRHHCGGFMSFNFSGQANGHGIAESYSYGFGPTYVDPVFENIDTYATPAVMACCGGPYDFDQAPSSQPTYFKNCKADAIQQSAARWANG